MNGIHEVLALHDLIVIGVGLTRCFFSFRDRLVCALGFGFGFALGFPPRRNSIFPLFDHLIVRNILVFRLGEVILQFGLIGLGSGSGSGGCYRSRSGWHGGGRLAGAQLAQLLRFTFTVGLTGFPLLIFLFFGCIRKDLIGFLGAAGGSQFGCALLCCLSAWLGFGLLLRFL